MLEKEMKSIWRKSSETEQIKFDLPKLISEMKNRINQVERGIVARDRREIIAALIGMPIFGYFAYIIPFPVTKFASILAIFIFVMIIHKLRSARKQLHPVDLSLPLRDQLEQQKAFFQKQKKLMSSVLYWYVLPPFVMNIIFILGVGDPAKYNWSPRFLDLLPFTTHDKITTIITLTIFYSFVVWINRKGARKNYEPILEDIQRVQHQLDHNL